MLRDAIAPGAESNFRSRPIADTAGDDLVQLSQQFGAAFDRDAMQSFMVGPAFKDTALINFSAQLIWASEP